MQLIIKSLVATIALFNVVTCETTWTDAYVFESMQPPMNSTAVGIAYSTDNTTNRMIASMMWYNTNNSTDASATTVLTRSTPKRRISARQSTDTIATSPDQINSVLNMQRSILINSGLTGNNLKSAFTQAAAGALSTANPGRNAVVFKQGSVIAGPGAPMPVVGQSLGLGGTLIQADVKFNAQVFQAGTFSRIGDGGFLNFAINGNCMQQGPDSPDFVCQ